MGFKGLLTDSVFVVTTRAGKISRSSTLRFAVFSLASVDFFCVVFYFRIIFPQACSVLMAGYGTLLRLSW